MNAIIVLAFCAVAVIAGPRGPRGAHRLDCPTEFGVTEEQCSEVDACIADAELMLMLSGQPMPARGSRPTEAQIAEFEQILKICADNAGISEETQAQIERRSRGQQTARTANQLECPTEFGVTEEQCSEVDACIADELSGQPIPARGSGATEAQIAEFKQILKTCADSAGISEETQAQIEEANDCETMPPQSG